MKILKSKKALSPVVASIILIAVTVAVSIAVAAWMGALTFTFTQTEELKVLSHTWDATTSATKIWLKVRNTGTGTITLNGALVNNGSPLSQNATGTIAPGNEEVIEIGYSYTDGVKYEFAVLTGAGNKYTYPATAPS